MAYRRALAGGVEAAVFKPMETATESLPFELQTLLFLYLDDADLFYGTRAARVLERCKTPFADEFLRRGVMTGARSAARRKGITRWLKRWNEVKDGKYEPMPDPSLDKAALGEIEKLLIVKEFSAAAVVKYAKTLVLRTPNGDDKPRSDDKETGGSSEKKEAGHAKYAVLLVKHLRSIADTATDQKTRINLLATLRELNLPYTTLLVRDTIERCIVEQYSKLRSAAVKTIVALKGHGSAPCLALLFRTRMDDKLALESANGLMSLSNAATIDFDKKWPRDVLEVGLKGKISEKLKKHIRELLKPAKPTPEKETGDQTKPNEKSEPKDKVPVEKGVGVK